MFRKSSEAGDRRGSRGSRYSRDRRYRRCRRGEGSQVLMGKGEGVDQVGGSVLMDGFETKWFTVEHKDYYAFAPRRHWQRRYCMRYTGWLWRAHAIWAPIHRLICRSKAAVEAVMRLYRTSSSHMGWHRQYSRHVIAAVGPINASSQHTTATTCYRT
jgi:hypothetical protein